MEKFPDFIICGAPRSGTTSLYQYLSIHPDVFLPEKLKEINYFSRRFDRGPGWYSSFFINAKDHQLKGDISPTYIIQSMMVSERMASLLPKAKLIFIFRNPVDRAFSHYQFQVQRGKHPGLADTTFQEILKSHLGQEYIQIGEYIRHIRHFEKYYPRQQMFFIIFEDLIKNPATELELLNLYLGIKEEDIKFPKANPSKGLRFKVVAEIRRLLRSTGLINENKFPRLIKSLIKPIIYSADNCIKMENNVRKKLSEHYTPFNEQLAAYLDKDLSLWRE